MNNAKQLLLFSVCMIAPYGTAHAHGEKSDDGHDKSSTASADIDRDQHPWGVAAAPDEATRTIEVAMNDTMRFTPSEIAVQEGETVTFVVANEGKLMHEFVLGTEQSIDEHAEMMKKFPNMEHAEPFMAHVPPGKTGEITWTFNRDGTVKFACLIAGHFEAGMVGAIDVDAASK